MDKTLAFFMGGGGGAKALPLTLALTLELLFDRSNFKLS